METRRAKITITEADDRWLLQWNGQPDVETHRSAAEALESVKTMGRTLADAGMSTFFCVEWRATTSIGRSVIKVLQE